VAELERERASLRVQVDQLKKVIQECVGRDHTAEPTPTPMPDIGLGPLAPLLAKCPWDPQVGNPRYSTWTC
jgi:hypothetical protein